MLLLSKVLNSEHPYLGGNLGALGVDGIQPDDIREQ